MRYSFLLPRLGSSAKRRRTHAGNGRGKEREIATDRSECEREREIVTKGLIKKRRQTRRGLDQARRSESVVQAR